MKLEVNIEKKYFFVIVGAFLLLAGVLMVYAGPPTASKPNPGHDISELQQCPTGSVLKSNSLGAWECGTDVVGGSGTTQVILNTDYCNSMDFTISDENGGMFELNLIKDGKNICKDVSGCTISIWRDYRTKIYYYNTKFKQQSDNRCSLLGSDVKCLNGDDIRFKIMSQENGDINVYDDIENFENVPDKISIKILDGINGDFRFSVCDY